MNFQVIDHPLIKHKITLLRDKNLPTKAFREITNELTMLLTYEISRDVALAETEVETPMAKTIGYSLEEDLLIVPVLRAGLGMEIGVQTLIPQAKIAHIGMFRDPTTHLPEIYYEKYPTHTEKYTAYIVDPLLATGGSIIAAIDALKKQKVKQIKVLSIIGVKEGIENIYHAHPDVKVYLGSLDSHLNENAYIIPGLGDAGDRLFGTK